MDKPAFVVKFAPDEYFFVAAVNFIDAPTVPTASAIVKLLCAADAPELEPPILHVNAPSVPTEGS